MNKSAQYFIFGDQSWPVESVAQALPSESQVSIWIDGKGWILKKAREIGKSANEIAMADPARAAIDALTAMASNEAVAIVGFENPETSQRVTQALKTRHAGIKILELGSSDSCALSELQNKSKRHVAWGDLVSHGVDTEISLLSIQDRVKELREFLREPERIAILLQEDPDPDGLAAALALRKILGRNSMSAPIVSFGSISRPENAAMSMLLDIEVEKVRPEELSLFDKVVMVDCQPSFFKGKKIAADVVIDHHPRVPGAIGVPAPKIEDIREDLGSISSLLTQYLRAADLEPSQRLATALLYGIKSDTLHLNRQVSDTDLEAFCYLYKRMNGNLLCRIERPEMPFAYLEVLREGLKNLKNRKSLTVLALGDVQKEEWIPQAADFLMQTEGTQTAFVCGIFETKVVISARNCNDLVHCGEVVKKLFDEAGCAGGHRTMAKAIIPLARWREVFGSDETSGGASGDSISAFLLSRVGAELDARISHA